MDTSFGESGYVNVIGRERTVLHPLVMITV